MLDSAFQGLLAVVDSLHQLIGAIVTLIVCGFAILAGGREERAAGVVICLASFATPLVQNLMSDAAVRPALVAIDVGLLAFLGLLALRSDRYWPMWAAGFHLMALLAYGAYSMTSQVMTPALFTALNLIAYLVLLALLLGVLGHRRERLSARAA